MKSTRRTRQTPRDANAPPLLDNPGDPPSGVRRKPKRKRDDPNTSESEGGAAAAPKRQKAKVPDTVQEELEDEDEPQEQAPSAGRRAKPSRGSQPAQFGADEPSLPENEPANNGVPQDKGKAALRPTAHSNTSTRENELVSSPEVPLATLQRKRPNPVGNGPDGNNYKFKLNPIGERRIPPHDGPRGQQDTAGGASISQRGSRGGRSKGSNDARLEQLAQFQQPTRVQQGENAPGGSNNAENNPSAGLEANLRDVRPAQPMVPATQQQNADPQNQQTQTAQPTTGTVDDVEAEDLARKQRLLKDIQDNHPHSQAAAGWLSANYDPENEAAAYLVLQILRERHPFDEDWAIFARPLAEYIEDIDLADETWGKRSHALDNDNLPGASRVRAIWESNSTAHSCRLFISRMLDGLNSVDHMPQLRQRIWACTSLVQSHNPTDDDLWKQAPRPERYFQDGFDYGEDWPLDYHRTLATWINRRSVMFDAFESYEVPQEDQHMFADLENYADKLAVRERLYLPAPRMPANGSAMQYLNTIRAKIRRNALALFIPAWHDRIKAMTPGRRRARAEEELQHMQDIDELPYSLDEALWRRKWRNFASSLGLDVRPLLRPRFEDIKAVAVESLSKYFEFLDPPTWKGDLTVEQNLDCLGRSIRSQQLRKIEEHWARALEDPPTDMEEEELEREHALVLQGIDRGIPVWRPGEAPPSPTNEIDPLKSREKFASSLGFGGDRIGVQGHWNFKCPLGAGTGGNASLWVKLNSSMHIIGTVVAKECFLGQAIFKGDNVTQRLWDTQNPWYGDRSTRRPLEAFIPTMLGKAKDSDNIVRCLGAGIYDLLYMFRLYSEFCPHGDLRTVIDNHLKARGIVGEDGQSVEHRIPERAMWAILEALTSAVCIMQLGRLPGAELPDGSQMQPVLHADMKPDNIFLAAPDRDDFWPNIPVAKLGDFGLSHITNHNDPMIPAGGTEGYRAPEQSYPAPPAVTSTVCKASDVWNIGRVMLSLVNLEQDPFLRGEYGLGDAAHLFPPRVDNDDGHYSARLIETITSCLQQKPKDRPKIEQLWKEVHLEVASLRGLRGGPMMKEEPPQDNEAALLHQEDKYRKWIP